MNREIPDFILAIVQETGIYGWEDDVAEEEDCEWIFV